MNVADCLYPKWLVVVGAAPNGYAILTQL
jgi:hypothetical protein